MKWTWALALVTGCGWLGAVWAQESTPPPRDWSWLGPGKTTREEIERRAGPPARAWKSVLTRGVLDLRPSPNYRGTGAFGIALPRVITDPKTQIEVAVIAYDDGAPAGSEQILVLHQGRLLYAILPPLPDETGVGAIGDKMVREARSFRTTLGEGCLQMTHLVMEYASERIAFLMPLKAGSVEAPTQRVKWCGTQDFAPAFENEWRIPEDQAPAAPSAGSK